MVFTLTVRVSAANFNFLKIYIHLLLVLLYFATCYSQLTVALKYFPIQSGLRCRNWARAQLSVTIQEPCELSKAPHEQKEKGTLARTEAQGKIRSHIFSKAMSNSSNLSHEECRDWVGHAPILFPSSLEGQRYRRLLLSGDVAGGTADFATSTG